jgi:hypothetical protein
VDEWLADAGDDSRMLALVGGEIVMTHDDWASSLVVARAADYPSLADQLRPGWRAS